MGQLRLGVASADQDASRYSRAQSIYFRKCIDLDNSYPSPFQQLANIYFQKKDYANALKYADLYGVTTPTQFQPIKLKTDILIAQGDKAKAEAAMVQYADSNQHDPQVRRELVNLYRNDKRFDKAMIYQRQLVALSTRSQGDALVDLAKLHVLAGQNDSALTVINDAVAARVHRLPPTVTFSVLRAAAFTAGLCRSE